MVVVSSFTFVTQIHEITKMQQEDKEQHQSAEID